MNSGLWLGAFSDDDLDALDALFYDHATEPADGKQLAYTTAEWNTRGLSTWESAAVERFFASGTRVAVLGAGAGREVLALLERGYDAVGFEPHPALVAAGSALLADLGHPGRLLPMERGTWPVDAGMCDGVVIGWGSYMLIRGRERRVRLLSAARASMPAGGHLLLSFFVRGSERTSLRIARVANAVRRIRRAPRVDVGDGLAPNFVHGFVERDIAAELSDSGFELVHFDAAPYGHAVGRAVMSAHR